MENMVTIDKISEVYKNKRVFITGHTGFKGTWMTETLKIFGAQVKGYALECENRNDLFNLQNCENSCLNVIADIRDKEKLIDEITSFRPDFIFHLAAQPLVRESYNIPCDTFEVNALGTAYLLDAVRSLDNKCSLVLITTDKVYQNKEWDYPYRENDRLGGYDPYSASKACAENIISSYRNSFFNLSDISNHKKGIAVARAGNVIGGGDWSKDRLLPDIVNSLNDNKTIIIRSPDSIRPWQHVLEPIIGYVMLGLRLDEDPVAFSEAYNFGPNSEDNIRVEDLVKMCIDCWGSGSYEVIKQNLLHESKLLKLDISKTKTKLNWRPIYNSDTSIRLTINWYKNYFSGNIINIQKEIRTYLNNYSKINSN
jgi:CDP-glucose 4,6-dehydratase